VKVLKKGDFLIIGAVAAVFILSVVFIFSFSNQGSRVVIKQNNEIIYNQSINQNDTVDTGSNIVIIKDGVVFMNEADCKNQICVKSGKISKKGESIVCLPNKVIVEIK
jgi:hypothetical protein